MRVPSLAPLLCASLLGCTQHGLIDMVMNGAPRPASARGLSVGPYRVLAGDLHCHVTPPDAPWHVSRELPETIALAQSEELDFVVLTPHVRARFFQDPDRRAAFLDAQRNLRAEVERLAPPGLVVIPGFEYTDFRWGHVGGGFADVEKVLGEVPIDVSVEQPELFFQRYLANGGVLAINHPLVTPIVNSVFSQARSNLSWRAFTEPGPLPPEIAFVTRAAPAIETYNLGIAQLRDSTLLGDSDATMRRTVALLDRATRAGQRRITPVGGSDSHGHQLRPTTYVLATALTAPAIRDAVLAGRTCVRGPEACTLEARGEEGWLGVGSSLHASGHVRLRARGDAIAVYVNGAMVARPDSGVEAEVVVPDSCAVVRAQVGDSVSAPIYVNCAFAEAPRGSRGSPPS